MSQIEVHDFPNHKHDIQKLMTGKSSRFDFWFDLNDVSKVALKCLFDHQHAPVNILKKNTKAENRIYFIRVKCYVIFCWKIFRNEKRSEHTYIYVYLFFLLQSYLDLRHVGKKVKRKRCWSDVFTFKMMKMYLTTFIWSCWNVVLFNRFILINRIKICYP